MTKQTITRKMAAIGATWHEGNDQKVLIPDGLGHRAYKVKHIGIRYCYSLKEIEAWLATETRVVE